MLKLISLVFRWILTLVAVSMLSLPTVALNGTSKVCCFFHFSLSPLFLSPLSHIILLVNKTAFEEALKHIFDLQDEPMSFISLNDATLSEWTGKALFRQFFIIISLTSFFFFFFFSAPNLAQNLTPKWHLDFEYDLFGHHHAILDFRCPLEVLHGNFREFFDNYIKGHL